METFWWTLSLLLMALGLVGAVVPVLPDSLLILAGALLHHFTVPPGRTVGWVTLGALVVLTVAAHLLDVLGGAVGAQRFGATRWGALGGLVGTVGGLFFFPVGLVVGPLVGVLCAEVVLAGRRLGPALRATWGSLLGSVAGLIGRVCVDVAMVAVFFLGLWWRL